MVLNLGILKIILSLPTRSDQYIIGPLEVTATEMTIMSIGIENTTLTIKANNKSNNRLTILKTNPLTAQ